MPTPITTRARGLSTLGAAALLAACAGAPQAPVVQTAGCLSDAQINGWMADYNARKPTANPSESMTAADAACTRAKLQKRLAGQSGPLVGYKAGLTNPAVQKNSTPTSPCGGRSISLCC